MAPSHETRGRFAIGVDYGTNSMRALVVDLADGAEVASCVYNYPSGEAGHPAGSRRTPTLPGKTRPTTSRASIARWAAPSRRPSAIAAFGPTDVVGIGVDTTGSTPLPVDRQGTPLAMHAEFRDNLAAHAWLWKDHTGFAEAAEITEKARRSGDGYLDKCGGAYSSEWFWSKILHCRADGAESLRRRLCLGRTGRLHPGLHHRQPRSRHTAPRHLRRRTQGHVSRAMGRAAAQQFLQEVRSRAGAPWPSTTPRPRLRPITRPADSPPSWPGKSACRPACPWPSAPSTPTWARWGRASGPERW